MKQLQLRYHLLHIFYWTTSLCVMGYVAVFLQYKHLTNTQIGIVMGGGACLSIFTSPFISSLVRKYSKLTLQRTILLLYCIQFILYLSLTFLPLSPILLIILYILLINMVLACVPLISMICMNLIKSGNTLNFGLSRGFGSLSYASSAVLVGSLVEHIHPYMILVVYFIASIAFLVTLLQFPHVEVKNVNSNEKEISVYAFIKKYQPFFFILVGFSLTFGASNMLSTFLVNIVHHLHGTTSLYGLAIFFMAASELPFMAITYRLLKKYRPEQLIMLSACMYIVRNGLICFAPSLFILFIGMAVQGCSYGLFTATITYYVNDYIEENDGLLGQTMIGMMSSGLGSTLGNVLGGSLQDIFSLKMMLTCAFILTLFGSMIMVYVSIKKAKLNQLKEKS